MKLTLTLIAALFIGVCANAQLQKMTKDIDLSSYLAQHDLQWSKVPKERGSSAFIGNGMLGSTIWSARDETLHWDLGRHDVYDTGDNKFRMPIGKLILKTTGKPKGKFKMRQSLYKAEVTGSITTEKGQIEWRSMIPHHKMVGLTEFATDGKEDITIDFYQLPVVNSRDLRNSLRELIGDKLNGTPQKKIVDFSEPAYSPFLKELSKDKALFCNPSAQKGVRENITWLIQPFKNGGGYVIAYGLQKTKGSKVLLAYTIDYFSNGTPSNNNAIKTVKEALKSGYDNYAKQHYAWWDKYYQKSFVSFDHKKAEQFYWLQLYKMASATKKDGVVLDQIGPWLRATAWARVWNNTNIQIAYHSMMTSNRLDLCTPFIRLMNSNYKNFENAVPEEQRDKGVLAIGRTMDLNGVSNWRAEYGNLSWVLHDYWMYCRYTGNNNLIVSDLFPLLKGAAKFMINSLSKDNKGYLHFPPDISPEYSNTVKYKDTTYDLALMRWNLRMLLAINKQFKINDPSESEWKNTLNHLFPYPVNENGLMIGSETPFDRGHRHYSHLMPFFPLCASNPDSPEGHQLFTKTFEHWESLPNGWNLFSHFGAASMAAWLRDGNKAVKHIENGLGDMTPSSFFRGPGPAIESVLCGVTAIGEMLIQSWSYDPFDYRISIMPGVPADWKNIVFHNLRAEGAFEVSAEKQDGKLKYVEVTSLAGNTCKIEAPFDNGFTVNGDRKFKTQTVNDSSGRKYIEIDLKKGETVQLVASSEY